MLVGAGLVATTLISNLFAVGPAFENLITDFRPALTQQSIDTAHADIAGLAAVQTEFSTKLVPALSQQLKMTPDQFNGFVSQNFQGGGWHGSPAHSDSHVRRPDQHP